MQTDSTTTMEPGPSSLAGSSIPPSSALPSLTVAATSAEVPAPVLLNGKGKARDPLLRYVDPYWHPYRTSCKMRWEGRQLLEVVSTEFRDRSVEYYRHAIESGVTKVNGKIAKVDTILKNGDHIENTVHRHEPPIHISPILLLHESPPEFIVISKPGGIPVHATGRYFKHTVLEVLKDDFGIKAYSVNRLDRLTSGLMILALSGKASARLAKEFIDGKVKKEYIARVRGKFPEEEITCNQSLLTVDRQMGLVICTPDGKESETIFKRMHYDEARDESVVHCRPMTGRTHQIRVHLQYLGHPIVNDPLYGTVEIWGPNLGRGGVDLTPSGVDDPTPDPSADPEGSLSSIAARMEGREALPGAMAPRKFKTEKELAGLREQAAAAAAGAAGMGGEGEGQGSTGKLPREMDNTSGHMGEIVGGSPVYLSLEARGIIAKLRKQKDEQEDWAKWSQVMYDHPPPLPPSTIPTVPTSPTSPSFPTTPTPTEPQHIIPEGFCQECQIPLPPDPNPESLFIYLHAWRYTTENLGEWVTPLPVWAEVEWDGVVR